MPALVAWLVLQIWGKGKLLHRVLARVEFEPEWDHRIREFAEADLDAPNYSDFSLMRMVRPTHTTRPHVHARARPPPTAMCTLAWSLCVICTRIESAVHTVLAG